MLDQGWVLLLFAVVEERSEDMWPMTLSERTMMDKQRQTWQTEKRREIDDGMRSKNQTSEPALEYYVEREGTNSWDHTCFYDNSQPTLNCVGLHKQWVTNSHIWHTSKAACNRLSRFVERGRGEVSEGSSGLIEWWKTDREREGTPDRDGWMDEVRRIWFGKKKNRVGPAQLSQACVPEHLSHTGHVVKESRDLFSFSRW